MEQQQAQELEQRLREDWDRIRHQILDQFVQVSTADLDAAASVNDLVRRIADRSHHTEPYVETRLRELVAATVSAGQAGPEQPGEQAGQAESGGEGTRPGAEGEGARPATAEAGGQPGAEAEQGGEAGDFSQPSEPLGGPRQPFGGSEDPQQES
ncbi:MULTISPECIES: hypothetical protein [Protofrankia]|uniref:hypothetical protein n=1 Tax=Protofrankia TaxID=2994361 RepID=UPI0009782859|nr:hypothetical protein BL254_09175 [Protofrankia sp. BMG5.30]